MPWFLDEDTGSKVQPRNLVVFDSRQQKCHSRLSEAAQIWASKKEKSAIAELSAGVSISA